MEMGFLYSINITDTSNLELLDDPTANHQLEEDYTDHTGVSEETKRGENFFEEGIM